MAAVQLPQPAPARRCRPGRPTRRRAAGAARRTAGPPRPGSWTRPGRPAPPGCAAPLPPRSGRAGPRARPRRRRTPGCPRSPRRRPSAPCSGTRAAPVRRGRARAWPAGTRTARTSRCRPSARAARPRWPASATTIRARPGSCRMMRSCQNAGGRRGLTWDSTSAQRDPPLTVPLARQPRDPRGGDDGVRRCPGQRLGQPRAVQRQHHRRPRLHLMQPPLHQRALRPARRPGEQDQRCAAAGRAAAGRGLRWPRAAHAGSFPSPILAHRGEHGHPAGAGGARRRHPPGRRYGEPSCAMAGSGGTEASKAVTRLPGSTNER